MVVWDAENDARLMMAYIEVTDAKLGTDGWKAIAEKLGDSVTVSAISQRFTKVLKKKYGGDNFNLTNSGAAPTPGKSRGRKKKDAEADPDKTPRKRAAKSCDVPAGEDEEFPDASPSKKVKKEEKSYFDQDNEDF